MTVLGIEMNADLLYLPLDLRRESAENEGMKIRSWILTALTPALLLGASYGHVRAQEATKASSPAPTESQWASRCTGKEGDADRECEIFQRLVAKENGQRVAEFAIGFPKDQDGARGVIVLPLGVLLTDDSMMQIGEAGTFKFKVRYCINDGCFAFINLSPAMLDMMKKGNEVKVTAKSYLNQNLAVSMSLKGFAETLKSIEK